MAGSSAITVDLASGEIALGSRRVPLVTVDAAPGATPSRFRLADDVVVRAITFGERSRLVRDALADSNPRERLLVTLRATALEGQHSTLSDAVLLALAGGGGEAPAFERCAIDASRVHGWNWRSLHDTLALVVDGAIEAAGRTASPGEWNRFIFAAADTREIEELLLEMTTRLLARGSDSSQKSRLPDLTAHSTAAEASDPPPPTPSAAERSARATRGPGTSDAALPPAVPWPQESRPVRATPTQGGADSPGAPRIRQSALPKNPPRVPQRAARRALPTPDPGSHASGPSPVTSAARVSVRPAAPSPAVQQGRHVPGWPGIDSAATAAPRDVRPVAAATRSATAVTAFPPPIAPRHGLPALAPAMAPAFRPLAARTTLPAPDGSTRDVAARMPVAAGPMLDDLLDEVARALAAECDLRGLDA